MEGSPIYEEYTPKIPFIYVHRPNMKDLFFTVKTKKDDHVFYMKCNIFDSNKVKMKLDDERYNIKNYTMVDSFTGNPIDVLQCLIQRLKDIKSYFQYGTEIKEKDDEDDTVKEFQWEITSKIRFVLYEKSHPLATETKLWGVALEIKMDETKMTGIFNELNTAKDATRFIIGLTSIYNNLRSMQNKHLTAATEMDDDVVDTDEILSPTSINENENENEFNIAIKTANFCLEEEEETSPKQKKETQTKSDSEAFNYLLMMDKVDVLFKRFAKMKPEHVLFEDDEESWNNMVQMILKFGHYYPEISQHITSCLKDKFISYCKKCESIHKLASIATMLDKLPSHNTNSYSSPVGKFYPYF